MTRRGNFTRGKDDMFVSGKESSKAGHRDRKKHVLHSHPLLLLISFVVTYFSHFLLGLKHIDLGHGTKGEGGGGGAVRWWRGESKGWEEEEAGDSFWSQPLNKSVRARQKESMRETQRKTERERDGAVSRGLHQVVWSVPPQICCLDVELCGFSLHSFTCLRVWLWGWFVVPEYFI